MLNASFAASRYRVLVSSSIVRAMALGTILSGGGLLAYRR